MILSRSIADVQIRGKKSRDSLAFSSCTNSPIMLPVSSIHTSLKYLTRYGFRFATHA